MQGYDALSKWHFEAEVGEMRGIVALGEKGGIAALGVKFAEGDTETATLKLTLAQAEFLNDVLPMALSVLRARQERRAWEASLYDPFADLCEDEPSQTGTSRPSLKAVAKTTLQKVSAAVEAGAADGGAEAALPIPARRGAPWTIEEEAQLAEAHGAGQSVTALADHFDRSPKAIQKRLEKLGLVEAQAA